MKFFLIAAMATQVLMSQSAWAAERSAVLDVENMTCALCPITVSTAIKSVPGIASVKVSMEDKTATVIYDDAVADLDGIAGASTSAGYPAIPRETQ